MSKVISLSCLLTLICSLTYRRTYTETKMDRHFDRKCRALLYVAGP